MLRLKDRTQRTSVDGFTTLLLSLILFTTLVLPSLSSAQTPVSAASSTFSLLDYVRSHVSNESLAEVEKRVPHYSRLGHFGSWIDADHNCRDTREEALNRDAEISTVEYRDPGKCKVAKAVWHDPYTGTDITATSGVQIDHVVPLKNAYLSGAWQWQPARRCTYANFLHNAFHLMTVSGHENMSKGSLGPEGYLPPNESYKCQYVSIWMKIKAIWQLTVNKDELAAIEKVVSEKNCALSQMEIDSSGLDIERAATENVPDQCQTFGTAPPPQFPNGKNKPPETTPVTPVPAPTPVPPPVMPPAPQNGVAPDPAPVPAPSGV